jgi:hypothetical protein
LALRLTKPMAKAAGVVEGTPVRVIVKPGHIVIESETDPTLDEMLAAFDPAKHGGLLFSTARMSALKCQTITSCSLFQRKLLLKKRV